MKFDKSKVYTALNADELEVGSKVILADFIGSLKNSVRNDLYITTLKAIFDEDHMYRFLDSDNTEFALAYLVEEPVTLKWTDLKIGDIIEHNNNQTQYIITGIDRSKYNVHHLHYAGNWQDDEDLQMYHKVEK